MGITALMGVKYKAISKSEAFVVAHNDKIPKWMEANQLAS